MSVRKERSLHFLLLHESQALFLFGFEDDMDESEEEGFDHDSRADVGPAEPGRLLFFIFYITSRLQLSLRPQLPSVVIPFFLLLEEIPDDSRVS